MSTNVLCCWLKMWKKGVGGMGAALMNKEMGGGRGTLAGKKEMKEKDTKKK